MDPLTMLALDQAAHSPRGASSAERWFACPGSVRACHGIPSTQSVYAAEGTLAHSIAAEWLTTGHTGGIYQGKPVDKEMRDAVEEYVSVCRGYYQPAQVELGAIRGIEHRFNLSALHKDLYGTCDYWVYWPWKKHLIVLDFKYGAGIWVPVIDNLQAQYYALGAMIELLKKGFHVETIEIGISQPRCQMDGEPFRTWEIDALTLMDYQTVLLDKVKATEDPNAPLVPGGHCRFCPAAPTCPAAYNTAVVKAQAEFTDITPAAIVQTVQQYDPVKLKKALDSREFLKAYVKVLDEFAYAELEAGRVIPGYKLVEKRSTRQWFDADIAQSTFKASGISDTQLFEERVLKSPAQLEKAVPKELKGLISSLCTSLPSGHALVTDDDPRPAVRPTAQTEFTVIDVDPFG